MDFFIWCIWHEFLCIKHFVRLDSFEVSRANRPIDIYTMKSILTMMLCDKIKSNNQFCLHLSSISDFLCGQALNKSDREEYMNLIVSPNWRYVTHNDFAHIAKTNTFIHISF